MHAAGVGRAGATCAVAAAGFTTWRSLLRAEKRAMGTRHGAVARSWLVAAGAAVLSCVMCVSTWKQAA